MRVALQRCSGGSAVPCRACRHRAGGCSAGAIALVAAQTLAAAAGGVVLGIALALLLARALRRQPERAISDRCDDSSAPTAPTLRPTTLGFRAYSRRLRAGLRCDIFERAWITLSIAEDVNRFWDVGRLAGATSSSSSWSAPRCRSGASRRNRSLSSRASSRSPSPASSSAACCCRAVSARVDRRRARRGDARRAVRSRSRSALPPYDSVSRGDRRCDVRRFAGDARRQQLHARARRAKSQ